MAIVRATDAVAWTPSLSLATPGNSSFAYSTQTGNYSRRDKWVMIDFDLDFTPTIGTGSGNLLISTLPLAIATPITHFLGFVWVVTATMSFPAGRTDLFLTANSSTVLRLTTQGAGVTSSQITASELTGGASHQMRGRGIYRTSA